jgi:EmrB/QacA subfamily drug resistance transporter
VSAGSAARTHGAPSAGTLDAGVEERERLRYAWRALSVVSMSSVLTALGGSALNVALPQIVRQTHASAAAASWILLAFQLTTTVLMVVFGRLADMFGRRTMYLCGLGTYTFASLLAGFAPDPWLIVGLRVAQAAGSAMLLTNSAALVTDAFPRSRLGEGMGVYTASFSIAQLAGPTLGGFLAEQFGWRWVFWYNVPLGLACLAWGAIVLRRSRPAGRDRGLDLPGNVLVLVSLGGLLLALSEVTRLGFGHPLILAGLAGFAVLLPLFVLRELRAPHPVVDLRLFRDLTFALGTLTSFLNSVARVGVVFLIALFFQVVHGQSAVEAGLKVLPLSIAAMLASVTSGFLQRRLSAGTLALIGTALNTAGLGLLCVVISPTVPTALITGALVLIGLGSGIFLPSNTTVLLHELPSNRLGIVNAMRLMLQNTGMVVGTALALSIITAPLPTALHDDVFAATLSHVSGTAVGQLVTGYRWALICMVSISTLATLACFCRRRAST